MAWVGAGWDGMGWDGDMPTGSENLGEGRLHKTGGLRGGARLAAGQPSGQTLRRPQRKTHIFNIVYPSVNDLRCMCWSCCCRGRRCWN
jgi:hypothetical protein